MRLEAALDQSALLALLVQTGRHAQNTAESALAEHGLRYDLWAALDLLSARGTCAMAEIAEDILIPPPTLTRVIDRLIADGLVHRLPDPTDRRRVLARLTRRGEHVHSQTSPSMDAATDLLMSGVAERQRELLAQALPPVLRAGREVG